MSSRDSLRLEVWLKQWSAYLSSVKPPIQTPVNFLKSPAYKKNNLTLNRNVVTTA
jgi:hypothetical protein